MKKEVSLIRMDDDIGCLTCIIAEACEAHENLEDPTKCREGARYFVKEYCSKHCDKPLEFESFLKWIGERGVYQEFFGLHFVQAWNDEMMRRGCSSSSAIAPLKADEMYVNYLRHKPFLNCIEPKEPGPVKKKRSVLASPIVIAAIIIALGAVLTAIIVRPRTGSVQKRFQKLNDCQILNVETGEIKKIRLW